MAEAAVAGGKRRKKYDGEGISRAVMATAKVFGATDKEAMAAAGYSGTARNLVGRSGVRETMVAIRERLQGVPGYRLEDSLEFYRRVSEDEGEKTMVRLAARKELDSRLGYNAPQKVEVSEKRGLSVAVAYFNRLGVSPAELLGGGSCGDVEVEEVGGDNAVE